MRFLNERIETLAVGDIACGIRINKGNIQMGNAIESNLAKVRNGAAKGYITYNSELRKANC